MKRQPLDPERVEGVLQQVVHKPAEWLAYERAVVQAVHDGMIHGRHEFAADDVPEEQRPASKGLAGNVWASLTRASILEPVFVAPGQIKRRKSESRSRKAAWVNVYTARSFGAVLSWLEKHAALPEREPMLPGMG